MVYRRSVRTRRPRRSGRPTIRRRRATRTSGRQFVSRPGRIARNKPEACRCPGELSPGAKFALAQIDPFDSRCLGAKIPDSNSMPSLANCDTDQVNLTPDGTNTLSAFAFYPGYSTAIATATPAAGSTVSWTTAAMAGRRNATKLVDNLEAYRPVAHGVRLSTSLSSTTANGFVHIGLAVESYVNDPGLPSTALSLPTNVNSMTGLAYYKRVTLSSLTQSPLTVINKWIDDTAFRYTDPRTTIAAGTHASTAIQQYSHLQFQQSWATIVVMVEGPSSSASPVLSAEHVLLSEALPRKDSFIIGSEAAPNSPGTISAVSSMQSSTDFAHTEEGQDSYTARAVEELQRGAAAAGEAVFNSVAVPLMQRVGGHAVNRAGQYVISRMMGVGGIPGVNANPARLALTN